jgi:transposase InsO family protein
MQAVRNLVHHVGFTNLGIPMVMLTDSNGAQILITNPGPRAKSRQMQLEEHKLREAETTGNTVTKSIRSEDNPADAMTKVLKLVDHKKFKNLFAREPPNKDKGCTEYEKSALAISETPVGERGNDNWQPVQFHNSTMTFPPTTDLQMLADCESFGLIARTHTGDQLLSLHESTGHRNFQDVSRIYGIPLPKKVPWCRHCVENKAERHPRGRSRGTLEASRVGHTIHADTAGRFPQPTKGGKSYFSLLVDGYSNRLDLWLITTQGEYYDHFTTFVKRCEAHFGRTNIISVIHSDSASYYKDSERMRSFTARKGIRQSFSPAYTQSLNGKAERNIRTIVEMARTCLNASGLPRQFYGEAIMYAVMVLNHIPRKGSTRTPDEIWQGRSARTVVRQKFMPFGCAAWAQVLGPDRGKFDKKAELQVHLNYDPDQHAYRIASLPQYRITYSGHVHFNKGIYPCRDGPEHYDSRSEEAIPRQRFHVSHYEQDGSEEDEQPERKKRTREPSAQSLRNIAAETD